MSKSVKLSNGDYIDAGAVWDNNLGQTLENALTANGGIFVRKKYTVTSASSPSSSGGTNYRWEASIGMTGYTVLMACVGNAYSNVMTCAWEWFTDDDRIGGYCSKASTNIQVMVLYMKN